MAKLVFGMNQSLDGYVDHMAFAPSPTLFRHFIEEVQGQTGSVYGRKMYEVMRYWDDDHPEWDAEERAFASAWRSQPKWVVSRSLKSVGPNATLVQDDLEDAIRHLKAERDGEIEVAGPDLARSLTELGLIDEYRIYLHPVVLGHGKPYFAGPRPPLCLVTSDRIGEDVIRLTYVPVVMYPSKPMHPFEKSVAPNPEGFGQDPFGYSALAWHKWGIAQTIAGFPVDISKPPTAADLKSPVLWMTQAHALSEAAVSVLKREPNLEHMTIYTKGVCHCQYHAVALIEVAPFSTGHRKC